MSESELHDDRGTDDNGTSRNLTAMPSDSIEAFPPLPTFPFEGSACDNDLKKTKTDIRVSHIPLPPQPNTSASAPPTSTLPTIPGGHSDEEQSSDASSMHSKPEQQESSNSSSISEPATAVEKRKAENKEDVAPRSRARAGSSSASMKNSHGHDNVRRLSVAGMQQLSAPEALPVAVVADSATETQQQPGRSLIADQLQAIRQSILSQPLRTNGPVTDGGSRSRQWDEQRRPTSGRTLSTPPTNRRQSQSQTASPRRNSFYSIARPPPLNLDATSHFNALTPQPSSQSKPSQLQVPPPSNSQRNEPLPPSPLPPSIPLPPMSIPTHLQLELAAQRPSPLYIHHSHTNDIPYESYAVKWERLKNVLMLPSFLERTLYFGALACLDAWLYNFTILPMRFCIAIGVLIKWWGYLAAKEARWMIGFVWYGLGRVWARARRPRTKTTMSSRRENPETLASRDRSRSRARDRSASATATDTRLPDEPPTILLDSETKANSSRIFDTEVKANGNGHGANHNLNGSVGHHASHAWNNRVHRHRRTKSMPSNLSSFHKADLLQGAVILFSSLFLMKLDASRMYHFIRAQDGIKLYVIYNVLEVGDRLLSALGQDIFECLFSSETLSRNSSGRSKVLLPLGMFFLALIYNVIHSVALYYQVITLNVAVNSYSNALLTLMISNQFVEIKSTVFKRFEKDNLFQLTCADIVERFQLWIMLLIIGMRNIVEVGGLSMPGAGSEGGDVGGGAMPLHSPSILPFSFTVLPSWVWSGEVLSPFLIVLGSEMLVDTIKHAYVNKFNNIKPTFYSRILDILCKDYYTNAFVTPSLTRRLGLAVIPLSCLFIRASVQTYHMFLSTRIPTPLPESTQTSLSVESATPSSPVMVAALDRIDTLIRGALGRAVYGYPYGETSLRSRSWWSWTSDDVIAAVTMIVVFFIAFLVLLIIKLVLGMILLRYSRNRYAKMKLKEHMVATGQEEREVYDAKGKRVGGYGQIEVTEDRRRWIQADKQEGLKGGKGRASRPENPLEGDYNGVQRYEMVAKRIW
ncbi:Endoplasmic reticulum membrane protein 65 [Colletotrichum chlorophyti]|uniref:Endoplasmic reticulum membrane protein 65 n=1 Tax=Colletotrichum chlorophyti TaxID=708187 RepID=A0A1Q8RS07_9PEZI|nr:Endoplasmic reticulum membrane protein 65 [Colletotrichum chlorophyti]